MEIKRDFPNFLISGSDISQSSGFFPRINGVLKSGKGPQPPADFGGMFSGFGRHCYQNGVSQDYSRFI